MKTILSLVLFLIWCFHMSCNQYSYAEEVKDRKLFAYVGGVGEIVKIDMQTYKIIKTLSLPPNGLHIVFGLDINPEVGGIYATGDMFSAPMIVIDSKTLKITKSLPEKGFEEAKADPIWGSFSCRGKLSSDGREYAIDCGVVSSTPFAIIDVLTFKIVNKPHAFHTNPIYQTVFSDRSKILYILSGLQFRNKEKVFENKIIIMDSETGKILKESVLSKFKNIKCETNISEFIGEKTNVFITSNRNFYDSHGFQHRGLLKGDEIYTFIPERNSKKIKLIEVKTRKMIDEIPIPDGEGDLNLATLTPDKKKLLISRGGYRHPGELTIVDVKSKKVLKRIMLEGGATSNVVFGYE